ncbi:MAG: hypothetical protein ABFD07_13005 [Methanobacterium sp.]
MKLVNLLFGVLMALVDLLVQGFLFLLFIQVIYIFIGGSGLILS